MELISFILSAIACVGLFSAGLFLRSFLPAYSAEKAKSLASKEDLAHLTRVVEGVKATHAADIERLKSSLAGEAQVMERRRSVYEEMCGALRIFIEGHDSSAEAKNRFHAAYAAAWLWASDEALNELNQFIALRRQQAVDPASVTQPRIKAAYSAVVLAMRKDVGFPDTSVQAASYQFFQFL